MRIPHWALVLAIPLVTGCSFLFGKDGSDDDDDDDDGDDTGLFDPNDQDGDGVPADEDCDDDDPDVGAVGGYQDIDGDGYGDPAVPADDCDLPDGYTPRGGDCDDLDSTVNPGVDELCDGIDNDCDDETDEDDAVDATTWYTDADGDGYGDDAATYTSCANQSDATRGGDCDESDADVNPGEDEVCDGKDNDCNGGVDDDAVDGTFFYADYDGDGQGDPDDSVGSCDGSIAGRVTNSDDCDDAESTVYTGATEICGDGQVNDCSDSYDAVRDQCAGTGGVARNVADGIYTSSDDVNYYRYFGAQVAGVGDFDGDGLDDFVMTEPYSNTHGQEAGAVYVELGPGATGTNTVQNEAEAVLHPDGDYYRLADTVEGIGDLDGDGYDDMLLYDWRSSGPHYVFVVYGPQSGDHDVTNSGWFRERDHAYTASFSSAMSSAGDVNGDGNGDLWLSRPMSDHQTTDGGSVHLFEGPITSAATDHEDDDFQIDGSTYRAGFGKALDGGHDIDGDGVEDVIVGAPDAGIAYVFLGPFSTNLTDADADTVYDLGGEGGANVSMSGDVDGDGQHDILITDPDANTSSSSVPRGLAYLFHGPPSAGTVTSSSADAAIGQHEDGLNPFYEAVIAMDSDGDGKDDVLLDAPTTSDGGTYRGRVSRFLAGPNGSVDLEDAEQSWTTTYDSHNLGISVADLGDIDGDGLGDIAFSANRTLEWRVGGQVYLIYGAGY